MIKTLSFTVLVSVILTFIEVAILDDPRNPLNIGAITLMSVVTLSVVSLISSLISKRRKKNEKTNSFSNHQ